MAEKRTIEARIDEVLSGRTARDALDFTAFLRANGLPPGELAGDGASILCGEESIGYIWISGEADWPWAVWLNACDFDESEPVDDDLKEAAWAHASVCGHFASGGKACGCGDQPGFHRTILGREFENRCHSPLAFFDPDTEALGYAQRLLLLLKRGREKAAV